MADVLLVEDDVDLRQNVAEFLTGEGFRIQSVGNGQEALRYLSTGAKPCVILLDLTMPVMDGWQFREAQLKHPDYANYPVILLSGDQNLPQNAADLSANGYLAKPFDLTMLVATVRKFCDG